MITLLLARERIIAVALIILMFATHWHHFGDALHLPDASLAVFFLAGIFVANPALFPLLVLEAGAIDWVATSVGGVSDWCLSPAYWFLIPTYGVLWIAGRWYARAYRQRWSTLAPLCGALFMSTSVAFLISNGSFYALSGRFPDMSWTEYAARVAQYYPPYLTSAFAYVAAAACVYVFAVIVGTKAPEHDRSRT